MALDLSLVHLAREARRTGPEPPLMLLLHGVGSNEADLFSLAPRLDDRLVVVSARAPLTLGPGAFGWFPIQFTERGPIHDPVAAERSRELLARFVGELVDAYRADARRVYVGGFSQGAIMTLALSLTQPEKVAGALAMSGRLLPELASSRAPDEALRGLPILVQHGLYDELLTIHEGRAIRSALERLPVELTYREYPMAHQVSEESLAAAAAWLSERLDTPPRDVR